MNLDTSKIAELAETFIDEAMENPDWLSTCYSKTETEMEAMFRMDLTMIMGAFLTSNRYNANSYDFIVPDEIIEVCKLVMSKHLNKWDTLSNEVILEKLRESNVTLRKSQVSPVLASLVKIDKIVRETDKEGIMGLRSLTYYTNSMELVSEIVRLSGFDTALSLDFLDYMDMNSKYINGILDIGLIYERKDSLRQEDFQERKRRLWSNPDQALKYAKELVKIGLSTFSLEEQKNFVYDEDPDIRAAIASNRSIDMSLVSTLIDDNDRSVRASIASHPELSLEQQFKLAGDSESLIRSLLLNNQNLPVEILEYLSSDEELDIKNLALAMHPYSNQAILNKLAKNSDENIRFAVAINPNTSSKSLSLLSSDNSSKVKKGLLERDDIDFIILEKLIYDTEDEIASAAVDKLGKDEDTETGDSQGAASDGYIYILLNPSMPGIVKIGKTRRNVANRILELSRHSGVPTPFELVYEKQFKNHNKAERDLHRILADYRISHRREFFKISTTDAVSALLDL